MIRKLLSSPFLLRRLIRSQESQAKSLDVIARILLAQYGLASEGTLEVQPNDDDDLTYSDDRSTWERIEREARRLPRPHDEDSAG